MADHESIPASMDVASEALLDLPVMEDLDMLPTMEELWKAIDCLAFGKAPGNDGIPSNVPKSDEPALLQHQHLLLCWDKGNVLQEMQDFKIA